MRGEIYDIDNKKFLTFGGARSQDIKDGILNIDEYEKNICIKKEVHILE